MKTLKHMGEQALSRDECCFVVEKMVWRKQKKNCIEHDEIKEYK